MTRSKRAKALKVFHDTIIEARNYLIILDNELTNWNEAEEDYSDTSDTGAEEWKQYRYYEMVMACLQDKKYKKDLLQSYGLKYVGVFDHYDEDGEYSEFAIVKIHDTHYKIPYYERHWFEPDKWIEIVKPVEKVTYETIYQKVS